MSYERVVKRLFEVACNRGMNFSLDNARLLANAFNFSGDEFPSVHIAGTNGKGSTTTKIARALELSGYKVGVYTSPHLFSFRERIVINGVIISEEASFLGLNKIFSFLDKENIQATFFEILTFLAFEYFKEQKVDVAVIETGLGGKFDATNVLKPFLSIITSISEDHVPLLGTTLEEIAAEKAGIIKENTPVVIGLNARFKTIYNKLKECQAPYLEVEGEFETYDEENSAIAKTALTLINSHFTLKAAAVVEGLKIRPPCRFEEVGGMIFDVAHNSEGFKALFNALKHHFPDYSFRLILGMSKDKEIEKCLDIILKQAKHIHLVKASSLRAAEPSDLAIYLNSRGYFSYSIEDSIKGALIRAKEKATNNIEICVVCGTFFIMKEAKEAINIFYPIKDTFDLNERSLSQSSCILN